MKIRKIDGRGIKLHINITFLKENFPDLEVLDIWGGECPSHKDMVTFTILTHCDTTTQIPTLQVNVIDIGFVDLWNNLFHVLTNGFRTPIYIFQVEA